MVEIVGQLDMWSSSELATPSDNGRITPTSVDVKEGDWGYCVTQDNEIVVSVRAGASHRHVTLGCRVSNEG